MRERLLLTAIGAAQGLVIWTLFETWPAAPAARGTLAGILTFVVASAAVLHFAWTSAHVSRLIALAVTTGAVYGSIATWIGSESGERVATWVLAWIVTLYVAGPFLQIHQRTGRLVFPYEDLFLHAWNNFFVALVGALFAGALWTVLLLWGALFELIEIGFFQDLFEAAPFRYVVTGAALGFGIALGRESERIVATLRNVTLKIFSGLLPLVCLVALLFLATLPVTGIEPLWRTDRASLLLMAWVTVTVLFFNAVYQEGAGAAALPRPLPTLVEAGLIAAIGFLAIAVWGLWLRIDQHGLTPTRMWAALLWIVLAAYALGYGAAVLARGSPWLPVVKPVNRAVAILVIALGLLAHTPLLDPLRWSARSQYARIVEGRVPAADFDYGFLRFELGEAGGERFEELARLESHPEFDAIRMGVDRARDIGSYGEWRLESSRQRDMRAIEALAEERGAPPGLVDAIRMTSELQAGHCEPEDCMLFSAEITNGPPDEWILASGVRGWTRLHVFGRDEAGGFDYLGALTSAEAAKDIASALREKRFESVPSTDRDLRIDGVRYRLIPER